ENRNGNEASYSYAPTRALIKSVSDDPVFLYPSIVSELPVLKRWSWVPATLIFLVAWVVVYFWVKPILVKMFLHNMESTEALPTFTLDESISIPGNMILLSPNTASAAAVLKRRGDVRLLDFADVLSDGSVDYANIRLSIVAVDHFDYRI